MSITSNVYSGGLRWVVSPVYVDPDDPQPIGKPWHWVAYRGAGPHSQRIDGWASTNDEAIGQARNASRSEPSP